MGKGLTRKKIVAKSNHSSGGGGGNITGSGANQEVTFWTSSSNISGYSRFVFDGTNVGIGIATPGGLLDVQGTNVFLQVDDGGQKVFFGVSDLSTYIQVAQNQLDLNITNRSIFEIRDFSTSFGDINNSGNGTTFLLDDQSQTIVINSNLSGNAIFTLDGSASTLNLRVDTSIINQTSLWQAGDVSGINNTTFIIIDDSNEVISLNSSGHTLIKVGNKRIADYDSINIIVSLGDLDTGGNNTTLLVNDSLKQVQIAAQAGVRVNTTSGVIIISPLIGWGTPTGTLNRSAINDSSSQATINHTLQALITDLLSAGYLHS